MVDEKPVQYEGESDDEYSNRKGRWEAQRLEALKTQREQEQGASFTPLEKFKRVWGG